MLQYDKGEEQLGGQLGDQSGGGLQAQLGDGAGKVQLGLELQYGEAQLADEAGKAQLELQYGEAQLGEELQYGEAQLDDGPPNRARLDDWVQVEKAQLGEELQHGKTEHQARRGGGLHQWLKKRMVTDGSGKAGGGMGDGGEVGQPKGQPKGQLEGEHSGLNLLAAATNLATEKKKKKYRPGPTSPNYYSDSEDPFLPAGSQGQPPTPPATTSIMRKLKAKTVGLGKGGVQKQESMDISSVSLSEILLPPSPPPLPTAPGPSKPRASRQLVEKFQAIDNELAEFQAKRRRVVEEPVALEEQPIELLINNAISRIGYLGSLELAFSSSNGFAGRFGFNITENFWRRNEGAIAYNLLQFNHRVNKYGLITKLPLFSALLAGHSTVISGSKTQHFPASSSTTA